jgi:FixJ family two-component response regulator
MQRTLTPKQIAVLSALLSGATNDEAAQIAGVSPATVDRYKAEILENLVGFALVGLHKSNFGNKAVCCACN